MRPRQDLDFRAVAAPASTVRKDTPPGPRRLAFTVADRAGFLGYWLFDRGGLTQLGPLSLGSEAVRPSSGHPRRFGTRTKAVPGQERT